MYHKNANKPDNRQKLDMRQNGNSQISMHQTTAAVYTRNKAAMQIVITSSCTVVLLAALKVSHTNQLVGAKY
jgi:hypothetical protein